MVYSGQLQFGHGFSAVETNSYDSGCVIRRSRFNSATAFQPWKHATAVSPVTRKGGFNSATAFQPWKLYGPSARQASQSALQFGHGFSAVETPRHLRLAVFE